MLIQNNHFAHTAWSTLLVDTHPPNEFEIRPTTSVEVTLLDATHRKREQPLPLSACNVRLRLFP